MNPTKAILPFRDDAEYLENEHQWIVARAARIGLQRRLKQDTGHGAIAVHRQWPVDDAYLASVRQRLVEAEAVERGIRDHLLEERLAVHRATPGACKLGLDRVCEDHNLNEDERLVLVIATIIAVSGYHADTVNDALAGSRHFSQTIDDCITLIDPRGATEAVRARMLFHADAPIVRAGLITVEVHDKHTTPADLLEARVSITHAAFAMITGVEELAKVGWDTETTPAT